MSSPDVQSPEERANYLRTRYLQARKENHEEHAVILGHLNFTEAEQTPIEKLISSSRIAHALDMLHNPILYIKAYVYLYLPRIINAGTLSIHTSNELLMPRYIGSGALREINGKLCELGLALADPTMASK